MDTRLSRVSNRCGEQQERRPQVNYLQDEDLYLTRCPTPIILGPISCLLKVTFETSLGSAGTTTLILGLILFQIVIYICDMSMNLKIIYQIFCTHGFMISIIFVILKSGILFKITMIVFMEV